MSQIMIVICFIYEEGRTIMAIRMTEEQFEYKYKLYSQDLFNVAYGYTRCVQDAEDIVQNVFIKLLQYEKQFNTLNDEKYWLIRVTINESINFVKSSYKRKVILNEEVVPSSKEETNDKYEKEVLKIYIASLPEKYKIIIILYYFGGDCHVCNRTRPGSIPEAGAGCGLCRCIRRPG